ncbi:MULTISPECIES: hypothetical protein [Paenibacillus]|jgi:hypothetical protein|uniref:hypothetical protein n=1 Tax=Paenibacillus TaxID=44249 RepID=UPI0004F68B91|nr:MULTISPECIES: hypothetical protein [unclassified Paenibacillus]AIQ32213.1 hypothetical protein P40081_31885 [Paenibacillus sp. FSL P4-0081]OMF21817.1 hypothetical protein BK132_31265 [Paenibacillus sp. FSL H8-0259]
MPNNYVINDNDQPVYVEMTNTFRAPDISAPPEISASQSAVLFSANASNSATIVLGLASAIITVRINNPAGSGRTLYLSRVSGSIGGTSLLTSISGTFTIVRGGTITSPATVTPVNNNLGSPAASAMTVQSSTAAITGGSVLATYQLAPGVFTPAFTGSIIVPPNNAISINVTSSSAAVGTIISALSLTWWER